MESGGNEKEEYRVEDECRVCRGGPEDSRPLHHPCLCKGSIGYVHQTCLEEWLTHSNKSVCELCHMKYQFTPHYSLDMPEVIPLTVIVRTTLQHFLPSSVFFLCRLIFTLFLWLVFVPLCVCWLYRIWLPQDVAPVVRASVGSDIISGITISAVVVLSLLLVMFLRNHWDGFPRPRRNHRRVRRGAQPDAAVPLQAAPIEEAAMQIVAPLDAPHAQQPVPEHMDAMDGGAEGHNDGGVVPFDELLGLRGPWYMALRNVFFLLGFDLVYLGFFGFLPYYVGLGFKLAVAHCLQSIAVKVPVPQAISETYAEFMRLSQASPNDLQLPAVGLIALGFLVMVCIPVLLNWLLGRMQPFGPLVLRQEKVAVLLVHRLFVLPVLLGSALLVCQRGFIEYPSGAWTHFAANNVVGFLALPWVMGVSFMLTVTLAVLQLREVLHPEILARIIRPQEAHADLFRSLQQEPLLTHARRTVVSMLVYLSIIFLFVFLPIRLCVAVGGPLFPLHIRVWYVVPEIQLPVELSIAHVAFLSVLELKKDLIGKLEYAWLRFACDRLGMSRFLLPYTVDTSGESGMLVLMHRPAPNWDAHHGDNVSRWAWGDEAAGEAEASVASRIAAPPHWLMRSVALLALSWLLVVCAELCILFAPVLLGKFTCYVLQLPRFLHHDPLNFMLGAAAMIFTYTRVDRHLLAQLARSSLHMPGYIQAKVVYLWLLHCASCFSLGLFITLTKIGLDTSHANLSLSSFLRDQLLGFALAHIAILSVHGAFHRRDRWAEDLRTTVTLVIRYASAEQWTALYDALLLLETQFVDPVVRRVLPLGPSIIAAAIGLTVVALQIPIIFGESSFVYSFELCFAKIAGTLACCTLVLLVLKAAEEPAGFLASKVQGIVRDRNYLVGRRLENVASSASGQTYS